MNGGDKIYCKNLQQPGSSLTVNLLQIKKNKQTKQKKGKEKEKAL